MKIPTIHGVIDRRMLINFTVEPQFIETILPKPFRPKLYKGKAIAGICLIRLKDIKPKGLPNFIGVNSENAAHRIAVEWEENGVIKEGVYIPRRDTSLRLNSLVGGRVFPGKHYFAKFNVKEENNFYHLDFTSSDDTRIEIDAKKCTEYNSNSIFGTLEEVSNFFEKGSVGYSPNKNDFEDLKLETYNWEMEPLEVLHVKSSFFEDETIFPKGSVQFDNAVLMTNIEHEWKSLAKIKCL